ncbi:2TM domain-containing protein [Methanoculleus sp.]|uniref:2TM domain-containing protein n=1 Tax=Methanoculleus sp. TaxID=90427 RepID=UPI0025F9ECA6|nr:2TM domain-containing protein [Methanoculleus sp.]
MDEQERYARAKEYVEGLQGFYVHLAAYIIVNVLLFAFNILTDPGGLWFYWVTIFWGVGLALHAIGVFAGDRVFGREWEERKIREVMEREKRR